MNNVMMLSAVSILSLTAMPPAEMSPGSPSARPMAAGVSLVTCWYDEKGVFTGSAPAAKGVAAGTKSQAAASGPHAWSYTIEGNDGSACPAKLPVSSFVQ
jgi:hypothetical protein